MTLSVSMKTETERIESSTYSKAKQLFSAPRLCCRYFPLLSPMAMESPRQIYDSSYCHNMPLP